jgi:aspartate/methionine/tyrosine aminotransferase
VRPALEGDKSFLVKFVHEIKKRRDFVVAATERIARISCDVPAAAFYVMIKADDPLERTDETFVRDLLEQTGVLVVPGSGFGSDARKNLFRLVYLADEGVLGSVFEKLKGFLEGQQSVVR